MAAMLAGAGVHAGQAAGGPPAAHGQADGAGCGGATGALPGAAAPHPSGRHHPEQAGRPPLRSGTARALHSHTLYLYPLVRTAEPSSI